MTRMRLRASLVADSLFDKPLAELEVLGDTAEPWNENFRRRIEGTVTAVSEHWDTFLSVWSEMNFHPTEIDGVTYVGVRNLQVDYDHYGFFSWLNLDHTHIRLILLERFSGSEDEYYTEIRARNQEVADYLSKWDNGQITRNDLRILSGLPPCEEDFFNECLPPDIVAQAKSLHLDGSGGFNLRTNLIV